MPEDGQNQDLKKWGGTRRGAGRSRSSEVDKRARLMHLIEAENEALYGKPNHQAAERAVVEAFGVNSETARTSRRRRNAEWKAPQELVGENTRGFGVPGWEWPEIPPACRCDGDQLPHWHCQGCKKILAFGARLMGTMDASGEFGEAIVACDDHCRDCTIGR